MQQIICCFVYGNHLHCNDGTNIGGGVSEDAAWQRHLRRIKNLPMRWYYVPLGRVGSRFVKWLTEELKGLWTIKWNSDHPLVFASIKITATENV